MTPSPFGPISWQSPQRQTAFEQWIAPLVSLHELQPQTLCLASADASFRRYLRIESNLPQTPTLIIMDAPPELEDTQAFVRVAALLHAAQLRAPQILAHSATLGFLLLEDLGADTMMKALPQPLATNALQMMAPPLPNIALSEPDGLTHELFRKALDALIPWQMAAKAEVLPAYDAALMQRELSLFDQWYLAKAKAVPESNLERMRTEVLYPLYERIQNRVLSAPHTYVHRDFMPRNLMLPSAQDARLGVLDFQDSVYGPITYDIASLLCDAFISWPEEFVLDITVRYWERARSKSLLDAHGWAMDFGAFYEAVQWMALQRHLKVAGIFARLSIRDQKHHYLADAPRFIHYIRNTCARYKELKPLLKLLDDIEGIAPLQAFTLGQGGA